ncbi:MAG TPA: aldehyde dehydrogenase family protein, partial [Burkholderiales bacterium]
MQRTVSPVDASVYVERELASGEQIEAALTRAVSAQHAWTRVPVAERAAICRNMAAWCVERADLLADELTRQMGRPLAHAPFEIRR